MDFEFKRASIHDVNIRHTANGGCIIKVGCCEAAFSTTDEMLEALSDYYKDPEGMEKQYNALAPDGPQVTDTGSGMVGNALSRAPNRVTGSGPSIREHQGEEAMDDKDNCEEIGPDRRR